MKRLLLALCLLSCSDDWVKYDCARGPAYHAEDELVCWTHAGSPFASRKWEASDNAQTACEFCDGFIP